MEKNQTRNHEVIGSIPGLTQWVKDLALLWLWCRLEATAPIRPLAWEPPYASGVALKKTNKQTNKTRKDNKMKYLVKRHLVDELNKRLYIAE